MRPCCCTGSSSTDIPCQPCADPVAPCTTQKHRIEVRVGDMTGVSSGDGMLLIGDPYNSIGGFYYPDQGLPCMDGSCHPQRYRRKKIFVQDFLANYCNNPETIAEMCEAIQQAEEGPTLGGYHVLEWTGCDALRIPGDVNSNVTYEDQSDVARIVGMYIDQPFKNLHGVVSSEPGCFAVVDVEYTYEDEFAAKHWYGGPQDGECESNHLNVFLSQTWLCRYIRKVQVGNKIPVGNYFLCGVQVNCFSTYTNLFPPGQDDTNCKQVIDVNASNYLSLPISPGAPWNPPTSISVTRIC
jgi:hypothetical protein